MTGSVQVNPDGLADLGARLAALAEEVRTAGRDLTGLGSPDFGASDPSYELADQVQTNVSSTATWVMTSASALAALGTAASEAALAYRATEQNAASRFVAMGAAFDEFDEMYELMTDPR
ncbi:MAG: hypothetical protein ABWZ98_06845 [Nakamurella sp.]